MVINWGGFFNFLTTYVHIVLWKFKDNANGMNRAQLAQEVKRRLDELPSHIPEIITYETGINVGTTVLHF